MKEITIIFRRYDSRTGRYHLTTGKYSNIYKTVRSFFW